MTLTRRCHRGLAGFWCALLMVVTLWPVAAAAQAWVATDIGAVGVTASVANAVSDTGQVVGSYTTAGGQTHAFSWTRNGGFVDLGTLGGTYSEAWGVNNAGQVVGWSHTAGNAAQHAFLWSPATGMLDIGTLGGTSQLRLGHQQCGPGRRLGRHYGQHCLPAFLWTAATGLIDLGTLGGTSSYATAIDDAGRVVGASTIAGAKHVPSRGPTAAAWWISALWEGTYSIAQGVNQTGQIVGYSSHHASVGPHAFRWTSGGGMVNLGTLGGTNSDATDVNDAGLVVGGSHITGAADGLIMPLPARRVAPWWTWARWGAPDSEATAVNNVGQVVGWAGNAANQQRAVIWSGPWKDLAVNFGPGSESGRCGRRRGRRCTL